MEVGGVTYDVEMTNVGGLVQIHDDGPLAGIQDPLGGAVAALFAVWLSDQLFVQYQLMEVGQVCRVPADATVV